MYWPQYFVLVWHHEQHAQYANMNPVVDADVVHGYGGDSGDNLLESPSPYPSVSAADYHVFGDSGASSTTTPRRHRGGVRLAHHLVDHRVHGLGNRRRVRNLHGHGHGVHGIHPRGYHHGVGQTGSRRWDRQQLGQEWQPVSGIGQYDLNCQRSWRFGIPRTA